MTVNEAYELTMSVIDELEKSGIKVEKKPTGSRNNPETVEKYSGENNIKPDKWVHITFYPSNQVDSRLIHEKARYLGNFGIIFDTGGGMGLRNWELDWSFHCSEIPDSDREDTMDMVEDMIDNMPHMPLES